MKLFGKIVLWTWFIVMMLIFALTLMMSKGSDALFKWYVPYLVLGVFFVPFVIYIIIFSITDKIKGKKYQDRETWYRENYIQPFEIYSDRFGVLLFEQDIIENTLKFVSDNLSLVGQGQIKELMVNGFAGETEPVLSAIYSISNRANEILDQCTELVKESYDEDDIVDKKGQPITEAFIRGDILIDSVIINLQDENSDIEISGGMHTEFKNSFTYEHGLAVNIDGKTNVLSCGIE